MGQNFLRGRFVPTRIVEIGSRNMARGGDILELGAEE
jgi:hypothetical protein